MTGRKQEGGVSRGGSHSWSTRGALLKPSSGREDRLRSAQRPPSPSESLRKCSSPLENAVSPPDTHVWRYMTTVAMRSPSAVVSTFPCGGKGRN